MATTWTVKRQDQGNNESAMVGIGLLHGVYTALTFSESKPFKTFAGAAKWLERRGYEVPSQPDAR